MFSRSVTFIRVLAFIAFTLSIFSIGWEIASNYNQRVTKEQYDRAAVANGQSTFEIYGDWGDRRRWKRIIQVPLTFIAVLCIRRSSIVSLTLSGLSIGLYLMWARDVYSVIQSDWSLYSELGPTAIALLAANPFDYALFGTLLIIFPCLLLSLLDKPKGKQVNQPSGGNE
jgi:hypothetical protein